MDPNPSTQNLNTGLGTQNNNTGNGAQYNAARDQHFNYVYPPPERRETPPKPSCVLPFRCDPDFVDRGTLLDEIREKCSTPASRVALVGLGGVGYVEKTARLVAVATNAGTGSRSSPSSIAIGSRRRRRKRALRVGNWVEAEAMSLQCTKTKRKILGVDNEDTLQSMMMVGEVYRSRGQWDAAKKLQEQVIETSKTKLGADHPDTLTSMANLAFTFKGHSKIVEAIRLMQDCCTLQVKVLGPQHPYTVSSHQTLTTWRLEDITLSKELI